MNDCVMVISLLLIPAGLSGDDDGRVKTRSVLCSALDCRYHFGSCGMHVGKGQDCEGKEPDTSAIENMVSKVTPSLFPAQLDFSNGNVGRPRAIVNGGWGDARDVALCKAFGNGQQLDSYAPGR
jgi:hypothetical protein